MVLVHTQQTQKGEEENILLILDPKILFRESLKVT